MKVMEQHICLISIGSNTNRSINIKLAQEQLLSHFPNIHFGTEQDTIPVDMQNETHFTNQIAKFSTSLSIEDVKSVFKRIEFQAGRLPDDKKKEIVKLDIDLLIYDSRVLKKSDLERDFVIDGLKEFGL